MIPLPGLTEQPLTAIEKVISAALEGILSLSSSLLCDSQKKPRMWFLQTNTFVEKTELRL